MLAVVPCVDCMSCILQARIFSPARTAGQQGLGNTVSNKQGRPWKIVFDTQEK